MRGYKVLAAVLASSFLVVGRAQVEPVKQDELLEPRTQIPVFGGDIPILGTLFQVEALQDEKTADPAALARAEDAQRRAVDAQIREVERRQRDDERALMAKMAEKRAANLALARFAIPQKMENAAFLGAGVAPAGAAVRAQLKLDKGIGLQVDSVVPGSPAEVAGIKPNDILEKLNEQFLVNVNQLVVLVRSFKGGDEVKITLLREGQRQVLPVKLVEKEVPSLDENNPWGGLPGGLEALPPLPPMPQGFAGGDILMDPRAELAIIRGNQGNFIVTGGRGERTEQQVFNDNNVSVTITRGKDGKRMLNAVDVKTGKEIFKGNIDTDEQRQALPPGVSDVLKRIDEDQARLDNVKPAAVGGFGGGGFGGGGGGFGGGGGGGIAFGGGRAGAGFVLNQPQNAQNRRLPRVPPGKLDAITWSDDENTFDLTASQTGDKRDLHLVAKNLEGTILFDGPINTDDDKKALPKDLADKLTTPAVAPVIDFMRGKTAGGGGNRGPDGFNPNNANPKAPRPPGAVNLPGAAPAATPRP
jgi:hypothetical protein